MAATYEALINDVIKREASDLFLSEGDYPRAKVGGLLYGIADEVLTEQDLIEFWEACGADAGMRRDVDTAYTASDGTRFRVNLYRHTGLLGAVLRLIKTEIPDINSLGVPAESLQQWVSRPSGLVLVTGATGSGKSTTLAATLEWLNQHQSRHIVTIEDPIEYLFVSKQCLFTQREVHNDTATFHQGLVSALRQAPDVILLGEIRDSESATTALHAAETGHLVLATLHSAGATNTLERLTGLFEPAEREAALLLLSGHLIGVLSQNLLPSAHGSVHLVTEQLENVGATRAWVREVKLPEIAEFMSRGDDPHNHTFMQSIIAACKAGHLSHEVAEAASGNAYEFSRSMRGVS